MPLIVASIKAEVQAGLTAMYSDMENNERDSAWMANELSGIIADAVDNYLKTADVNVAAVQVPLGIPVTVAINNGVGATTGPGSLVNLGKLQ